MSFPIQACAVCASQTENMVCPTCRRKLSREEVKVFWNSESWTQYRATVVDFENFSSSTPTAETRLLMPDDLPEQEERQAGRLTLTVGFLALVLVGGVLISLVINRIQEPAAPGVNQLQQVGFQDPDLGKADSLRNGATLQRKNSGNQASRAASNRRRPRNNGGRVPENMSGNRDPFFEDAPPMETLSSNRPIISADVPESVSGNLPLPTGDEIPPEDISSN